MDWLSVEAEQYFFQKTTEELNGECQQIMVKYVQNCFLNTSGTEQTNQPSYPISGPASFVNMDPKNPAASPELIKTIR